MKKTLPAALVAALALAGCVDEPSPAELMASDRAICAAQGFADGSDAMARCMGNASRERVARQQREEAEFQASLARAEQQEAARKHQKSKKKKNKKHAKDGGTLEAATGSRGDQANLSLCSDGKLREDCRNAPLGY